MPPLIAHDIVVQELTDAGLVDYFQAITGGDQISHSKPDPEIYLKACEKLGIDPKEAYAVEDSYNGIRSSFAAGMKPSWCPTSCLRPGRWKKKPTGFSTTFSKSAISSQENKRNCYKSSKLLKKWLEIKEI